MVPRAFPIALRLGVDVCHVSRIRDRFVETPKLRDFLRKLFTRRELGYYRLLPFVNSGASEEQQKNRIARYLAGRWAAKEAVIKATKPRKLTLSGVEIWPNERNELFAIILDESSSPCTHSADANSSPEMHYVECAASQESNFIKKMPQPPSHDDINGQIARLSISHDGEYAVAVALAAEETAE